MNQLPRRAIFATGLPNCIGITLLGLKRKHKGLKSKRETLRFPLSSVSTPNFQKAFAQIAAT